MENGSNILLFTIQKRPSSAPLFTISSSSSKYIQSIVFACLTYLRGIPKTVVDTEGEGRHADEPERLPDVHAQDVVDGRRPAEGVGSKSDDHTALEDPLSLQVITFLLFFGQK